MPDLTAEQIVARERRKAALLKPEPEAKPEPEPKINKMTYIPDVVYLGNLGSGWLEFGVL